MPLPQAPGAEDPISEETLTLRVQSFAQLFLALSSLAPDNAAAWLQSTGLLPEDFTLDEIKGLLADLTATDSLKAGDTRREIEERICGAALYLVSCHRASVARIGENWRAESGFVRALRRTLMIPPSEITNDASDAADYPLWTRIRAGLEKQFADASPELLDQAIIMEQSAWKQARRWRQRFDERDIPDLLARFWAAHHDKLVSGFPYFAFRSRFVHWWKQCAINWWMHARRDGFEPPPSALPSSSTISPYLLRLVGEGYRLVRTTIFRRPPPPSLELSPAEMIEMPRRAADDIFYYHIVEGTDDERWCDRLQTIAACYPALGQHTINDLSARLRARLRACLLARLQPWSNATIGAEKCASQRRGGGRTLGEEAGVFTLSSLVRLVPEDRTLLWVFTAHIFLRPLVDPPHADPWSFARYLRELWWWIRDPQFAAAVQRGAATGSRVDAAAWSLMQSPPFRDLLATLKSLQTEADVQHYLLTADLHVAEAAARKQIEQLIGGAEILATVAPLMRTWRRLSALHWIVPMWYLVFVERLGEDAGASFDARKIAYRLMVDPDEVETVVKLYHAMANCRRKTVRR